MSVSLADIVAELVADAAAPFGMAKDKLQQARAALVAAQEKYPDFAVQIGKAIAELDVRIAQTDSAAVPIGEVVKELVAIPGEGFSPARHPGDATGG